jgi:hypothetical protein
MCIVCMGEHSCVLSLLASLAAVVLTLFQAVFVSLWHGFFCIVLRPCMLCHWLYSPVSYSVARAGVDPCQ